MASRLLLAAARSPRLRKRIESGRRSRRAALRFVAGESAEDAATAGEAALRRGLSATVNLVGEDTTSEEHARAMVDGYLGLLQVIVDRGLCSSTEISVKLSGLGLDISDSLAFENLMEICAGAKRAGVLVTVDMEGPNHVDRTLQLVYRARQQHGWIGVAVQAYLRRTPDDCRDLAGSGSRVRLCKGAYAASSQVAYRTKAEVLESFKACLAILMQGHGYPMVATHDPRLIAKARSIADSCRRDTADYELQMLYGVRSSEQVRLAQAGYKVRVYIPFGDNWYGYFVRRVAERPANMTFAIRALLGSADG